MSFRAIVAVCIPALLAVTACEPTETVKVDAAETTESIADAAAADASAKRMPLPECEALESDQNAARMTDCRGMLPGDSGLAFEARYTPAGDGMTDLSVQIVGPGDATLQTIAEKMEGDASRPSLQDIDADGRIDLLLPLMSGNVNTNWAVWRAQADGSFSRAGELSGVEIARSADGYIASVARSGATMWEVGFFQLKDSKLTAIATAEVAAELSGDRSGEIRKTCVIRDDGGLAAVPMSPVQAEKKFCMDPLVSEIFN